MRFCVACFAIGLLAGGFSTPCAAGDVKDYLAKDGKLKEKLTLEITLGGGGLTGAYGGNVWVIEPSGTWIQETTAGFAGEKDKNKLVAKGQLTEQQLQALGHHLATQDFRTLPAQVSSGQAPDTSGGLSVGIGFGKKHTGLNTSRVSLGDSAPKADDPKGGEWSRFVALTLVLEDMVKRTKAEPKKDR